MIPQRLGSFLLMLGQVIPLALVFLLLFLETAPPDNPSGLPGVAMGGLPGSWYVFPLTIVLGVFGIAAIFSRVGSIGAAIAMLGGVAYGVRVLFLSGITHDYAFLLIGLSLASIFCGVLREVGRRTRNPQLTRPH